MPTGKPIKMKKCAICGKLFLPVTPSTRICNDTHYTNCPICGKPMIWNTTRKVEPCSKECRKEATRRKNQEKYGCDHPMQNKEVKEHYKQAMKDKYGVESPLQNKDIKNKAIKSNQEKFGSDWALSNKDVRDKRDKTMIDKYGAATTLASDELYEKFKQTNIEKYGVENPMQNESIQEKAKETNLEKYGVDNPMQDKDIAKKSAENRHENIDEIEKKIKQIWLDKYGVDNPSKVPEIMDKIQEQRKEKMPELMEKMSNTMIEKYGVPYYVMTDDCKETQGQIISKTNRDFGKLLEKNNIPYKFEHRIKNRSYDIEILDTNILIEIDPTYTHCTNGNHFNHDGLDKNYHLYKTLLAEDNGFECIHIFDWDDKEKIIGMLKPKTKISADSCQLWRLNKEATNEFLDQYDLQGSCRNQLLCLGLVLDNEIVQVMTFGKSVYDKNHNIVIRRMCTKFGYDIIGGYNRLLNYATEYMELYSVMIYVDASKHSKSLYENLDMTFLKKNAPRKIWSKEDKYKMDYTNRIYLSKDPEFISLGKSYDDYMIDNGWDMVYDCGVYVFEY